MEGNRYAAQTDNQVDSLELKRKRSVEHGVLESCDKKHKGGDDSYALPFQEIVQPAPRCGLWGGSGPPVRKVSLASSEHLSFCYD